MPDGRFSGAMTDYIQYAAGCLGNQKLDFKLTEYNSYEEETEALKSDEIDMIFHFSQNPDTERNTISLLPIQPGSII